MGLRRILLGFDTIIYQIYLTYLTEVLGGLLFIIIIMGDWGDG
jgi:hypothetical protein